MRKSLDNNATSETNKKKESISIKKKISFILRTLSTVLVTLVMILALTMVGPRFLGMEIYAVLSGSMEPEIPTGAIIYVKDVDPSTLEIGDDITYKLSSGTPATHRIIEFVYDEEDPGVKKFRTKGIANDEADKNPVHPDSIIGEPIVTIPLLGFLAYFIQSKEGILAAIAVLAVIFWLMIIPDFICPKEKKKKKKSNSKDNDNEQNGEVSEQNVSNLTADKDTEKVLGTETETEKETDTKTQIKEEQ